MEKKIDFKNPLLKRREVEFVLKNDKNPGFNVVKEYIMKEFKTEEEKIVVRKIKGSFGNNNFEIEAFIYDSEKDKEEIEQKPKAKKKAQAS